jgi:mRNA interferase RelE/StbE
VARVLLTRTARDALAALDFLLADAILAAFGELERDPHLGHRLRGRLPGLRSYRLGIYRIIYELRDGMIVRTAAIRHRDDANRRDPGEPLDDGMEDSCARSEVQPHPSCVTPNALSTPPWARRRGGRATASAIRPV